VAGEEGSAFHTLILLKDVSAKKFHIFRRHGQEHGNIHTIGDTRGVDQSFYSLKREQVLRAEGRVVTKISPNSSEILDILEVPVPAAHDSATPSAADAILKRILANFEPQRFLEVGATGPHLVVGSTAPTRVGVSPRFDFDPRTYAASGIDFYELRLRQYADLFHEDGGRFDVIRITGSEFEDVMASFRVSKRLAHEGTTWILGCGDFAARAALAIRMTHPGFTARRLFVQRTTAYVAHRVPGEPLDETGVGALSASEVKRRIRWVPPATLRRIGRRKAGTRA
jgi:hypothetical protein